MADVTMAEAQAALEAASKMVVSTALDRDRALNAAKNTYEDGERALRKTRDETLGITRADYKAILAAIRAAETKANGVLVDLMSKQNKAAARAKAATPVATGEERA
jgi:hypothetical protein